MKRFLPVALLLISAAVSAEVLSINQFSGINTDDSALTLQNGQSPDSKNVVTDDGPGVQGRKGFVRFSTEPSSGLFEFPLSNGTRYLITKSGGNLKATTNGLFTVLIGTIPTDRTIAEAVLGDKFFYSDTTNGLKYWDGNTVTTSSKTLTFDKLATFKGRLVGAGITTNPRVIYLSKYLDGTNFTLATNPSDDDPAQIAVSGSLDETIQALYSTFQDKLMYFKKNSFGGLSGSRRSNFALRVYSDRIGVSSVETIQDCDGKLRWLGNNRKAYEFDGSTFHPISEDIDNIFATVAEGDANSSIAIIDSQADWQLGTVNTGSLNATFSPGTLAAPTTNWFQTVGRDFMQGQFPVGSVYVDTMTNPGFLQTKFPETFDAIRSGAASTEVVWSTRTAGGGAGSAWTLSVGTAGVTSLISTPNTIFGGSNNIYNTSVDSYPFINYASTAQFSLTRLDLVTAAGDPDYTQSLTFSFLNGANPTTATSLQSASFSQKVANYYCMNNVFGVTLTSFCASALPSTYTFSASANQWTVAFGSMTMTRNFTPAAGWANGVWFGFNHAVSASISKATKSFGVTVDSFTIAPQYITYQSTAVDTGITTPLWDNFIDNHIGSGTLTYQTQVATSATATFDAAVSVSSGAPPTSLQKQFILVVSSFQKTDISTVPLSLDYIRVQGYSTGTYTSKVLTIGSAITAWGPIAIQDSQVGGSITYQFNSSSNSDVSLFISTNWAGVTNGVISSYPVAGYAAFKINPMTATTGTSTVNTSYLAVNWQEGSTVRAASAYFNSRYWLGLAVSSASNNIGMIYDKKEVWQKYDAYVPEALGIYNSRLYTGNTNGIFLSESGYSDNGNAINAYYSTKIFAPAGYDFYGQYEKLFLTTDNSDDVLTPTFQINQNATNNAFGSVAMNTKLGIQNLKYPFSTGNVQHGKFLSLKLAVTGSSFWRILNGNLYFNAAPTPE